MQSEKCETVGLRLEFVLIDTVYWKVRDGFEDGVRKKIKKFY